MALRHYSVIVKKLRYLDAKDKNKKSFINKITNYFFNNIIKSITGGSLLVGFIIHYMYLNEIQFYPTLINNDFIQLLFTLSFVGFLILVVIVVIPLVVSELFSFNSKSVTFKYYVLFGLLHATVIFIVLAISTKEYMYDLFLVLLVCGAIYFTYKMKMWNIFLVYIYSALLMLIFIGMLFILLYIESWYMIFIILFLYYLCIFITVKMDNTTKSTILFILLSIFMIMLTNSTSNVVNKIVEKAGIGHIHNQSIFVDKKNKFILDIKGIPCPTTDINKSLSSCMVISGKGYVLKNIEGLYTVGSEYLYNYKIEKNKTIKIHLKAASATNVTD